jgi:hypothetical protein
MQGSNEDPGALGTDGKSKNWEVSGRTDTAQGLVPH